MNGFLEPSRPQLDLAFARRGDRTVLDRRLFRWPFVLTRTFTLDRVPAHLLTVILQTGSGALHGEDRLAQRFSIGADAAAHCTTQGASPVHRAGPAAAARDRIAIDVEAGGYFEYWPEARILFPGAALDQTVDVDCAPGATALVGDAVTVHDPEARDRGFRRLESTLTLRCRDDILAVDRLDIRGLGRGPTARFKAFGTAVLMRPCGDDATASVLETLAAALIGHETVYAAVSPLPAEAGLIVRLAGRDLRDVRAGMSLVLNHIRHALFGGGLTATRLSRV